MDLTSIVIDFILIIKCQKNKINLIEAFLYKIYINVSIF